jgi:hypothetical protein
MTGKSERTIKNYWITPEEILEQDPCYPEGGVEEWFNGRKKARLSTILKDASISRADRRWIVRVVVYMKDDIPSDWGTGVGFTLSEIIDALEP